MLRSLITMLHRPWPIRKLHYRSPGYRNSASSSLREGCNLFGFAQGQFGIGQHLKGVAHAFQQGKIPFSISNSDRTQHPQDDTSLLHLIDESCTHRCNIFCFNHDSILDLWTHNRGLFRDRYNIGYGYWELSEFPDKWLPAMNVLDEIWAPTRHIQSVISEKASVPVVHMPPPVDFELPSNHNRARFGLPEAPFMFLFTFDFSSTRARKNPEAVVRAFVEAFPPDRDDVMLVLKSTTNERVGQQLDDRHILVDLINNIDDKRIRLIDETMLRPDILELINCADAYVSLHRAEGFGLGLAEAMKMGKPVIATAYSGNLDFTNSSTSCLIDYELIPVKPNECFGLEGNSVWADADVHQAAASMRRFADDPGFAQQIAARGQELIDREFSFNAAAERYQRRLNLIGLGKN